jgi:hypothetical protein
LYYKYDGENNGNIHGHTKDQDIIKMIKELGNGRRNRLHLFVDHVVVEPVPIEVVNLVLLLSQSPAKVDIYDYGNEGQPPQ